MMAGTAAQVPVKSSYDLWLSGIRIALEQSHRSQDHPGRAIAALHGALFKKSLLHWMQPVPLSEAFDGSDPVALRRLQRCDAGEDWLVVEEHRASAAQCFTASELRASQSQILTQDFQ